MTYDKRKHGVENPSGFFSAAPVKALIFPDISCKIFIVQAIEDPEKTIDFNFIRRQQERRAILTPILTDFTVRITAAPAIIFTKVISPENLHTEEILVCGHSLEVNMTTSLDFFLSVAQVQLLQQLIKANMVALEPSGKAAETY
uniref:Vacuolar protein sorting-associated protein 13B n=1 Tax=Sphaerodactylus townsendi TaxID=933632 RepID=A0ACB8FG10_9SAUR